jgi:tetratricopeptide (TPR) repeat protein
LEAYFGTLIHLKEWNELVSLARSDIAPTEIKLRVVDVLTSARRSEDLETLVDTGGSEIQLAAAQSLYELTADSKSASFLLDHYERHLLVNPRDTKIRRRKADLLRNLTRSSEAIEEYSRVLDAGPDDIALCHRALAYRQLKKFDDAIADFTLALTLSADDWTYLQRGRTYWSRNDYRLAIEDFEKAIKLRTKETWFFVYLGDCYRSTLDFAKAIDWLNRAVDTDATAANITWRAEAYLDAGQAEEALEDLSHAIELDPNYGWARRLRGECNRKLERYEEALADLRKADTLGSSAPSEAMAICMMLGLYEEAENYLAVGLAASPEEPWYKYLQTLLSKLRDTGIPSDDLIQLAIRTTRDQMEHRNDLDRLNSNIAIYSLALGDHETARTIYESLLEDKRGRFRIERFALQEISELAALFPKNVAARAIFNWLSSKVSAFNDHLQSDKAGSSEKPLRVVYCSLRKITGREEEYAACAKLLESYNYNHHGPVVALLRLSQPGWLYGQCNFKIDFSAEYDLKFQDLFDTVTNRDMEIFRRDLGSFTLIFKERSLFLQFKKLQIDVRYNARLVLA